jgi:hypothetical protein
MTMSNRPSADLRKSNIYRTIRILFGADLVIGLALAAAGYWIWNRVEIWIVGLGLAAVGLLMLWIFSMLSRRTEERESRADVNRR